jgi:hypothetical protein
VSGAKRGGRFSYLTSAAEDSQTEPPTDAGRRQETEGDFQVGDDRPRTDTDSRKGGEEGKGRTKQRQNVNRGSTAEALASVPKGQGRMKQERSQLNVRIPTTLKRQASAKAVLEGRDIGEVVEELLRAYLDT